MRLLQRCDEQYIATTATSACVWGPAKGCGAPPAEISNLSLSAPKDAYHSLPVRVNAIARRNFACNFSRQRLF
jgi:hypothetical protein